MAKTKVLLVDPPCQLFTEYYRFYYPRGLVSIATSLEHGGHEALVADLEHRVENESKTFVDNSKSHERYAQGLKSHPIWDKYMEILDTFRPDIVGVSALTPKVASALRIAKITKKAFPSALVILGGNHATTRPQDLLKHDAVDLVVRGEGEQVMNQFLASLPDLQAAKKIPGISFLRDNIVVNNPLQQITDLGSLPMPNRNFLMDIDRYRPIDMGMITTSRGCQYQCTFCEVPVHWEKSVRFRPIDHVLDEMHAVIEQFGTTYFSFRDSTFTYDRQRTIELCRRIAQELPRITWECLTKPTYIDKELLQEMKSAGCSQIRIGVESGSKEIVRYMRKGVTLQQVKNTALLLNAEGMNWSAYFMLGVPRETPATMDQTREFMEELDPPFISLARYVPMPGSRMFDEVIEAGMLDPDSTDWTWALNQSLDMVFTTMDKEVFRSKMGAIAAYVRDHNAKKGDCDLRLKK